MANQDINSISPKLRDNLLNQNIGKYSQITMPLINPIGLSIDIYNSTPILKNPLTPDGLLIYTNNNISNENYNSYRNLDSNIIDYLKTKNNYTPNYSYIDETSKGLAIETTNTILSYLLGDSVGLGIVGNNFNVNSSFDIQNTIGGLALGVADGSESKLGSLALRSLGLSLANSILDKTRRSEVLLEFLNKPLNYLDSIDKLDTSILNLNSNAANIIGGIFPIYLYSDVKADGGDQFNIFNNNYTWSNYSNGAYVVDINSSNGGIIPTENIISNKNSLLYKTQQLFISGKINTIITDEDNSNSKYSNTNGIVTRGRSLKSKDDINYARIWTANNQYRNVRNLIRPFNSITENPETLKNDLKRVRPGAKALETYGVLQDDGFVKISPYKDSTDKENFHKYMFSIENLAWKRKDGFLDSLIQGSSQDGPNGGRIMWFPPYDIKFTDNTNVNWNSDNFIGRGEPVYTYVNTERAGTLSFKAIVDHPSIINYYKQKDPSGNIIVDDDFYRFFAGNDVIDLGQPANSPTPVVAVQNKPITQSKPIVYTFKVYFPNYYSGVDDNPNNAMTYLYKGKDCDVPIIDIEPSGYEMDLAFTHEGLTSTSSATPCPNSNFYFRTDNAYLKTILKNNILDNYKDLSSNGLNSNPPNSQFSFKDIYEYLVKGIDNKNISGILNTITKIQINGSSSHQGTDSVNKTLAINRGNTIKNWILNNINSTTFTKLNKQDPGSIIASSIYKNGTESSTNTNDLNIKQERFVLIQLTSEPTTEFVAPNGYTYNNTIQTNTTVTDTITTRPKVDMYGYSATNPIGGSNSKLWNDESQFFEKLGGQGGGNGDFILEKFTEKIKYFHPAFHSSTPEGFNSRLTFLHQCTRQGNTENNAGLATNLAFGRPPICVLRIGDFYNTKIIIDNLNIDFEPLVWDMNTEGIGVQPMLANINISFKFIGGSDLTGPIARLQNAITFNFFANTGVYDDRNDRITSHDPVKGDTYYPMYNPISQDNSPIKIPIVGVNTTPVNKQVLNLKNLM